MNQGKAVFSALLALLVCIVSGSAGAVGFTRLTADGPAGMAMGIWYPSDSPVPDSPNSPFRQALALDAPVAGDNHPLVVISHGYGGWMGGHADLALTLAESGYVVVAPEHPGNNSQDQSAVPAQWLVSRPADIHRTLDFMLQSWPDAPRIDAGRIGVYGFSAGGYTALVAAGGKPDFTLASRHCSAAPGEFLCAEGMLDAIEPVAQTARVAELAGDSRLGAVVVAAPGLAFAFDSEGLEGIGVPVQIWSGERDLRVPDLSNGGPLAENLPPGADLRRVANAGHFAFMVPCNPRLKEINPRIWQMVCIDNEGFDRAAFHTELNREIRDFFDRSL
ncbi:dienelactone hydrolase family protein [Marinobacterium sp. D7]|uniref:alpha/beta hydrolase family protein n=1 Tax=Marinobacterium ramblicola TaxID=2849041 RepID=UPI001C2CFBD4|nr:dienelactone hydrolase family protein [Marinobacterium ramblicola]MBV1789298.1 dienelactone hydrolase family protein [Marinobacterium ramblicola]